MTSINILLVSHINYNSRCISILNTILIILRKFLLRLIEFIIHEYIIVKALLEHHPLLEPLHSKVSTSHTDHTSALLWAECVKTWNNINLLRAVWTLCVYKLIYVAWRQKCWFIAVSLRHVLLWSWPRRELHCRR